MNNPADFISDQNALTEAGRPDTESIKEETSLSSTLTEIPDTQKKRLKGRKKPSSVEAAKKEKVSDRSTKRFVKKLSNERQPRDPSEETKEVNDEVSIQENAVSDKASQALPETISLPDSQEKSSYSETKKNHRGKRGGKKRSRKDEAENKGAEVQGELNKSYYLSIEELCKIPALPPGKEIVEEFAAICESQLEKLPTKNKKKSSKAELKNELPKRRMFISVIPHEQVEVGLAEDGALVEYYLDMLRQSKLKGNIYKGVIHNIDPNLQAAFVDFGVGKNGFLQIDEVHPEYWQAYGVEQVDNKKLPPIQKVLRPGQEVLVQVVKEPSGNKGAFLTTWLSLAGRFLVLTPGQEQVGVSRKVTDVEERARLREMMNGISPGTDFGVIVRTVGEGATKTTLKTDLQYLKRLWREIRKKVTECSAPALIYQEPGLSERAVRDYLTEDVAEIWVDNAEEANNVRAMAALLFPRKKNLVHIYEDKNSSLWDHFNLRKQLEQIYAREVLLPSGGRLVFDQTEALMAIDINSGRISGKGNFEAMAFKTNMEASELIARQLRLRDVGGQVVIDFIEMRDKKHVQEVEKNLRQAMKNDRARHEIAHISSFGLLELVRQRMGSSALSLSMEPCAACGGTGLRRNLEWQALQCLRELAQKMKQASGEKYTCEYPRELGLYLLNYKREALQQLENDFGKTLEIKIQI